MTKESAQPKTVLEPFIQLIAPFAPHLVKLVIKQW